MSSKETIRRIIKEETNFMRIIMRRFPPERLDSEFQDSLNYISKMFLKNYKANPRKLTKEEFKFMVIRDLIDGLELRRILPTDIQWLEEVEKSLSEHFKDRISSMYNVLKK